MRAGWQQAARRSSYNLLSNGFTAPKLSIRRFQWPLSAQHPIELGTLNVHSVYRGKEAYSYMYFLSTEIWSWLYSQWWRQFLNRNVVGFHVWKAPSKGASLFKKRTICFVNERTTRKTTITTTTPFWAIPIAGPRSGLLSFSFVFTFPITKVPACTEIRFSCPATGHREKLVTVVSGIAGLEYSSITCHQGVSDFLYEAS